MLVHHLQQTANVMPWQLVQLQAAPKTSMDTITHCATVMTMLSRASNITLDWMMCHGGSPTCGQPWNGKGWTATPHCASTQHPVGYQTAPLWGPGGKRQE